MALSTPYVCGAASAAGASSIVIPISVDVARTDPVLGASFVFIFLQLDNASVANPVSVSDDAPVDDAYSLCLFTDGLNHYDPNSGPMAGMIVNPLVNGVNNITVTFDAASALIQAVAIAVTGIGAPGGWPGPTFDPSLTWWPTAIFAGPARQPVGVPVSANPGVQWGYATPTNAVVMTAPTGAVDGNWDWATGEIALYWVDRNTASSDPGGFTWSDGSIVSLADWHPATGLGGGQAYMWENVGYGFVTPTLAGPSLAGALGDASTLFGAGGTGFSLLSGAGPVCTTPPVFGNPCFNHRLSAGPDAGASGTVFTNPAFQARFPAGPDAGSSGSPTSFPAFAHRFRLGP